MCGLSRVVLTSTGAQDPLAENLSRRPSNDRDERALHHACDSSSMKKEAMHAGTLGERHPFEALRDNFLQGIKIPG